MERNFDIHCKKNSLLEGTEEWALHYECFDNLLELQIEVASLRESLSSLGEMRIVYLYKCIEISIKNMLYTAYRIKPDEFRWKDDKIIILEEKGISTKGINGYDEINELRKVNNTIKHSYSLHDDLSSKFVDFRNVSTVRLRKFLFVL